MKHAETKAALMTMIRKFDEVVKAGGYRCLCDAGAAPLRADAIEALSRARWDLELCKTHSSLLVWINDLSINLKLMHNGLGLHAIDVSAEQLEAGRRLIGNLACEEVLA